MVVFLLLSVLIQKAEPIDWIWKLDSQKLWRYNGKYEVGFDAQVPCGKFKLDTGESNEFLTNPAGLWLRNTSSKKRKQQDLSRKAFHDSKTM